MAAFWTSSASSSTWNDTDADKIAPAACRAMTERVAKDRPSRTRSTSKRIGSAWSPRRMK